MAVTANTIKCPDCGANISVEEGREKLFCSYCGSQIILTNENEHIIRHIDEAAIKQIEAERDLRIKEIELEERDENNNRKSLVIAYIVALAFEVIGVLICIVGHYEGMFGITIGIYIALGAYNSGQKRNKRRSKSNEICISESMTAFNKKDYNSVVQLFKAAGFVNVNAAPLHDLNLITRKKNGKVDTVTINGNDDFQTGDIFPKDSNVLITYHSR